MQYWRLRLRSVCQVSLSESGTAGAHEAKDGISENERRSGIPAVATLDSSHIGSLLFVLFKESLKMDSPRLRELSPAVRGSQDAQDA